MSEEQFLKGKFQEHYLKNFVKEPPSIERREFGFGVFGRKISERHFSFKDSAGFNSFLRNEVPFFASCSPAHYEFPDATPMDAKRFLGSDLVWEFDADDFKTACAESHTLWKCPKCGLNGKGRLQYCTGCGEKTVLDEWVCPECLQEVRKQALELVEWLRNDLGFSEGLSVNFSGSKGFHIHLRSESVFKIPQSGRVELLNYLTAHELDLNSLGFLAGASRLSSIPLHKSKGWQEKILQKTLQVLESSDALQLHSLTNLREKEAQQFLEQRSKVLQELMQGRLYNFGKKSPDFWRMLFEHCIEGLKLRVDRQTSVDLAKIVRVPETLHGSTGLLAKKIPLDSLKGFDALSETIVFSSNPVKLLVERAPRFFLKGEWFEALERQEVELPEFAAVFLLAKQAARLAGK